MYFPYLRGRQFELLAIRELMKANKLSENVIPIIEPVKFTSTLSSTIETFKNTNNKLAIISNPEVGDCFSELSLDEKKDKVDSFQDVSKISNVIWAYLINSRISSHIKSKIENKEFNNEIMAICLNEDNVVDYLETFDVFKPNYSVIPYDPAFRDIRDNRVQIADRFKKKKRNSEYDTDGDEPFSKDHLYYREDNYIGFSDYSIIGNEYSDSGFAPYAVAIHIVFFRDNALRIKHFVSDSNDDISDPANKFHEAVGKLVEWNKIEQLNTIGIQQFEEYYKTGAYPGLGVAKKLSIMHHLEIMGEYLNKQ